MKKTIHSFTSVWKEHLAGTLFSFFFVLSFIELLIASKYCKHYIGVFASRGGLSLADPLLALFAPRDFSLIIFILFHGILITAIIALLNKPKDLAVAFQAYAMLMIFRTITIYLIPLQAPADMIFLSDPLANLYMHNDGNGAVVNDLFFSGHVSSSFLFFMVTKNKLLKRMILMCTIIIAILIIWQKVHYTVDVVFAPLFSIMALYLSNLFAQKVFSFSPFPMEWSIRRERIEP
ncbi:MAG: hypothetical protein IPP77_07010 [Bacteroidetes bacterium]|nr:hypothetical protein [Bacteroidota bacterium]